MMGMGLTPSGGAGAGAGSGQHAAVGSSPNAGAAPPTPASRNVLAPPRKGQDVGKRDCETPPITAATVEKRDVLPVPGRGGRDSGGASSGPSVVSTPGGSPSPEKVQARARARFFSFAIQSQDVQ